MGAMSAEPFWTRSTRRSGPLLVTAIHDGHGLRDEVAALTALSDADRRREEDPHTAAFTLLGDEAVVVELSRFEVDLNRPRERAVYRLPEDAWGLSLWKAVPDEALVARSLDRYDAFYAAMTALIDGLVETHGGVLLLDVHSYNHRRGGPDAPPDDPAANPEVNLGTGSLDRERWGPVADACLEHLGAARIDGRPLDVRENVRFRGGRLSTWANATWPGRACALALEFKKTFLDEWSGRLDGDRLEQLVAGLDGALPALRSAWRSCL